MYQQTGSATDFFTFFSPVLVLDPFYFCVLSYVILTYESFKYKKGNSYKPLSIASGKFRKEAVLKCISKQPSIWVSNEE